MSERYCAWIRIGGRINASKTKSLLKTIREASVSLGWGEPLFTPESTADLMGNLDDGWLWLCDDEARYGEFQELEKLCRDLGLSYTRHSEAWCGDDAVLVDWRPGMKEPIVRRSSNEHTDAALVMEDEVRRALAALDAGNPRRASRLLKKLCPDIPDLPSFEIIG